MIDPSLISQKLRFNRLFSYPYESRLQLNRVPIAMVITTELFRKNVVLLTFIAISKKDLIESLRLSIVFFDQLEQWLLTRSSEASTIDEYNKYRSFSELARMLSLGIQHKYCVNHKLFTIIRSPFVFKKTREQFKLSKYKCVVRLELTKNQLEIVIKWVGQLQLPGEVKVICR